MRWHSLNHSVLSFNLLGYHLGMLPFFYSNFLSFFLVGLPEYFSNHNLFKGSPLDDIEICFVFYPVQAPVPMRQWQRGVDLP